MSDVTVRSRFFGRLFGVPYRPRPHEQGYLERAETQKSADIEVTAAALSKRESQAFFGVRMARKGIQPVWVHIRNGSGRAWRLEPLSVDPTYYTPLEAAYVNHFAVLERFVSLGLVAWVFLPLLPILPFKLRSARRANERMNALFREHGYAGGPIAPGDEKSGFVFATLSEGTRQVDVELRSADEARQFQFSLEVPGLALDDTNDDEATGSLREVDEAALIASLREQPRATADKRGRREGDPLNLVVVGSRATVQRCLGARWDPAETVDLATSLRMAKAFVLDSAYLYAPVSPLYVDGRQQHLALQRARATVNERLHLRLWRTGLSFGNEPVWIGQISRDIGVRFTAKTWNLTTHKIDPDVDEARDYLLDDLMAAGCVSHVGYVTGAQAAPESNPRFNLTGDPYFTDGLRAVAVLSPTRVQAQFLAWDADTG